MDRHTNLVGIHRPHQGQEGEAVEVQNHHNLLLQVVTAAGIPLQVHMAVAQRVLRLGEATQRVLPPEGVARKTHTPLACRIQLEAKKSEVAQWAERHQRDFR